MAVMMPISCARAGSSRLQLCGSAALRPRALALGGERARFDRLSDPGGGAQRPRG